VGDTVTTDLWTLTEGEGPLFATAPHHGHEVREEVEALLALPEEVRLREEDPFTGAWAEVAGSRLVPRRSRFEVDLNRPRDRAVYLGPEDAWGLGVWREEPPADLVQRSLAEYDAFYGEARRMLQALAARHGRFVVFDLHSYNHRRAGPGAAFDAQSRHPDVNIGTGSVHGARWAPIIHRIMSELRDCEHLGRRLDVRENVKFLGGNLTRWINDEFAGTGCSIAIEFKKFFMDEWSGQLYVDVHRGILHALRAVARGVAEELGKMAELGSGARAAATTRPRGAIYGDLIIGVWRCPSCEYDVPPQDLKTAGRLPPFLCPCCQDELVYDEEGADESSASPGGFP
jgi:N-formylglutamate amidohydrolase